MRIRSATFVKGVVGLDPIFDGPRPQVAFVGRSNVGKSSTINALTGKKGLAKSSGVPGKTKELNVYLINSELYFVDLPGYGFVANMRGEGNRQMERINWYLFGSPYRPKVVVVIIDAVVGPTRMDLEMLEALEKRRHEIIVVANKIDKLKQAARTKQLEAIHEAVGFHMVIPCSAERNFGINELLEKILE